MKINIYGSTGEIGKKALNLIDKNFSKLKVNLLCANKNYKLIIKQIEKYKPDYVYLDDPVASKKIKLRVDKKTKILTFDELIHHLKISSSHFSILAISGYKSLIYLEYIINNTQNLGIVSKEAIVSAGHIFKKKNYFGKTKIFPLDSEHFSLYEFFNFSNNINNFKRIIITASGGPFYKHNFKSLNNVSFDEAIKHPKWKIKTVLTPQH